MPHMPLCCVETGNIIGPNDRYYVVVQQGMPFVAIISEAVVRRIPAQARTVITPASVHIYESGTVTAAGMLMMGVYLFSLPEGKEEKYLPLYLQMREKPGARKAFGYRLAPLFAA